ncbi:LptM family lipoprotein [Ruminococcus flavefaciens]|uniref:LptM family lipoprotein n=1 Tax=Ruminococcus flavefaciens TaxID=1265 RepID=UPI0004906FF4|nr:hypothetical protein [Ruminococcus flavefaciens]
MKKIISIFTLICLLVSLCGCGKNKDESNTASNIPQNKSEETNTFGDEIFVDQDNIKISFDEKQFRGTGIALEFLIDNKSERDITVITDSYTANDYMLNSSDSESVLSGKKTYLEIFIFNSDLRDLKIDEDGPYEFDFKMKVIDKNDSEWSIKTEEITLNISDRQIYRVK